MGKFKFHEGDDVPTLPSLIASLIRWFSRQPSALFLVEEEHPALSTNEIQSEELQLQIPWYTLSKSQLDLKRLDEEHQVPVHGLNVASHGATLKDAPQQSLLEVFQRYDHPFEPLMRAAKAMDVAFEDPHVVSLLEIERLQSVMALPPKLLRHALPDESTSQRLRRD